jgi:hypothetical protein
VLFSVTEDSATKAAIKYFNGWKNNDIKMIIDSVEEDVVVIESHGPTYHGINDLKQWFDFWLKAKSRIIQYDINNFYFCEKDISLFCEWNFKCSSFDKIYSFPGASIIKISMRSKISLIHEYKMTKFPYLWDGQRLTSE